MSEQKPAVVLTTLAFNQTTFFGAIAEALRKEGYEVILICFHERSAEYLRSRGLKTYNVYKFDSKVPETPDFARFGIDNVNLLTNYEKVGNNIHDSNILNAKLWRYLNIVNDILIREIGDRPALMVQEFGGSLALVAAFYAARANSVDNYFMEPSFFRGRVSFVRNSFNAPRIVAPSADIGVSDNVRGYLDQALAKQQLVIPKKDSHQYRSPLRKLTDPSNIKRLLEKLFDKYVLGKSEEWDYIGWFVWRHVRMLINSLRLRLLYKPLSAAEPFVYYPLHVPNDAALTIRAPEYTDQYALLDYLARIIPHGYKLAIKEHPALVGAISYQRIRQLAKAHDNFVILNPGLNNYNVMSTAKTIITINSKSGAEALLLEKPILVLGDAFYRDAPAVITIEKLADLPSALRSALSEGRACTATQMLEYFQRVWDSSHPGELYDDEPQNIQKFVASIMSFQPSSQSFGPTLTTHASPYDLAQKN